MLGSSKGGTAAIYYAIKHGYGYAIAGEPQIEIAKYLKGAHGEDVLSDMVDDMDESKAIIGIDKLIYDAVEHTDFRPLLLIHAGIDSYHYHEHILPFVHFYNKKGGTYLLNLENYAEHYTLTKYFPFFLIREISEIFPELTKKIYIKSMDILVCEHIFSVRINAFNATKYALYVFKDGKRQEIKGYQSSNIFTFDAETGGGVYLYRIC